MPVLELDGSQHLADREAYRRDRRKDALLQEHGYLVLRFLAENLGTRLDAVLDEVLRALASRTVGRMTACPVQPPPEWFSGHRADGTATSERILR